MSFDIAQQLNNLVKEYASVNENSVKKGGLPITFFSGEPFSKLQECLKNFAPMGKVAVLYDKQDFDKYGKQTAKACKRANFIPTHVVLPDDFYDEVSQYSPIFNLAEDVRMIIAFNAKFYSLAKYFASIREIPCTIVVGKDSGYNFLTPSFILKNGKKADKVSTACAINVIIDQTSLEKSEQVPCDLYAHTVSFAYALIDYRINASCMGEPVNLKAYALASKAVQGAYAIFSASKKERNALLIKHAFALELADYLSGGQISNVCSSVFANRLSGYKNKGKAQLLFAIASAKILQLLFSGKYDKLLTYPNYLERAEFLQTKTKLFIDNYILGFIDQTERIESNKTQLDELTQKLSVDLDSFVKCSSSMLSTYSALKGDSKNDVDDFASLLKHSGDGQNSVNGMSLCRDLGILELI